MFSRSSGLVWLAIYLCVQAVPHSRQEECNAISTVTQTVTVTADGPAASSRVAGKGADNDATSTSPLNSAVPTSTHAGHHKHDNNGTMRHGGDANNHGHNSTTARASRTSVASTAASTNTVTRVDTGNNSSDPQTSLTLDPRVIASGFANNGQAVPSPGQVSSLTSTNNFINFCLTVPNLNITNGKQITTGSCNPAPMGLIPSSNNMPSAKFTFPQNFGTLKANQTFTIEMAILNLQTGYFVNADANYFAAPQQLNGRGQIQGHSHVVIQRLTSLQQTTPTNPKEFVFFKGLNDAAINGKLNASVPNGLDVGFYKLSSINTASNHQPVLVPIAQHGSLDDTIYFSVTSDGVAVSNGGKTATGADNSVAAQLPASATVRAAPATPSPSITAAATSTRLSHHHNIVSASVPLSHNSGLSDCNTDLLSATVIPTVTLVPGTYSNKGSSSSLPSTQGKRQLSSRFTL